MYKSASVFLFAFCAALASFAQLKTPVKWSYNAKKLSPTSYELQMTAQIDPGWHIYTIDHKGEIGIATSFVFNANPLGKLDGKTATKAKAVVMKDPSTGENVKFYQGTVVFSQKVSLKAPVKTNFSGSLEFMACDDRQCTAPTTKSFNIALQ